MAEQDAAAKRRARQTLINLALALAATVAVALVMIMITPRDDSNLIKPVDYVSVAADVSKSASVDVTIPHSLPKGWWANAARFNDAPSDGVKTWHVGFVGPKNQYLGIDEGFNTNPTWVAQFTRDYEVWHSAMQPASKEVTLAKFSGVTEKTKGQLLWIFQTTSLKTTTTVILSGTASEAEFAQFAVLLGFGLN